MREVVFRLHSNRPGHLEAHADDLAISIAAASLEELHHEARDALIGRLGSAHGAYQVRIRRDLPQPSSLIRSLGRPPARCC